MSKGQKLRRQMMAAKSAAAKEGSSDQGDSDGREETVKQKNIIAKTGFYFATSPRQLSPPTLKKKTSFRKHYRKPKQPVEMEAPAVESQPENDYYCADNSSGGFYYQVDGNKGWIRFPQGARAESAVQLFDFTCPPPIYPGSPVVEATIKPESISSLESLNDSHSTPLMTASSNIGSCLSLNTTFDSGTDEYGWSYAVCKAGPESSAASMASPSEPSSDSDWQSGTDSSASEEETLAQQIKQVSILWD